MIVSLVAKSLGVATGAANDKLAKQARRGSVNCMLCWKDVLLVMLSVLIVDVCGPRFDLIETAYSAQHSDVRVI